MTESTLTFDITPLMAPYLDVHMISPLLEFLREVSRVFNRRDASFLMRCNVIC